MPTFFADDFTRERIRATAKLPVLPPRGHSPTSTMTVSGTRARGSRADRLWRLMAKRSADLNAFRLLPLQSAEVYAREAIRLLGAGRVLFRVEYPEDATSTPPGATP